MLIKVTAYILPIILLGCFQTYASTNDVRIEKLLETDKSWDGVPYKSYPAGQPQLTVVKIIIAPNTSLKWHEHAVPNVAYLMSGELTVKKKSDGAMRILSVGDVLPEVVDTVHTGFTGEKGATLIVFYAGQKGIPLSSP